MLAACTLFGGLALVLGQDVNYDQRNYHLYGAYAWLTGRADQDILAAQFLQSFHNPLLNVPAFLAIRQFPPAVAGFLLGAAAGINVVLVYALSRRLLAGSALPVWVPALATAVGVTAPLFLSETGTTFGDNLSSLPILGGILLLTASPIAGRRRVLADGGAGILLGTAAGLKLVNAPYALAAGIALLIVSPRPLWSARLIPLAAGIAVGIALGGGLWMAELQERHGNPLFPYYNAIFRSPHAQAVNWRDDRWLPPALPEGLAAIVRYPLAWATAAHPLPSSEKDFRDPRWLVLLVLAVAMLVTAAIAGWRRRRSNDDGRLARRWTPPQRFLLVFTTVTFPLWLFQFGYSRYLIPLDLLSGVVLWLLVGRLPLPRRWRFGAGVALSVLLIASGHKIPNWGRLSWTESWFGIPAATTARYADALIVLASPDPIAYVIPDFPPQARFIRIDETRPDLSNGHFADLARSMIAKSEQPVVLLGRSPNDPATRAADLARFGLAGDTGTPCTPLPTRIETLFLCPLNRMTPPASPPS